MKNIFALIALFLALPVFGQGVKLNVLTTNSQNSTLSNSVAAMATVAGGGIAKNSGIGTNVTLLGGVYGSNAIQILRLAPQYVLTNSLFIGNGGSNTSRSGVAPVDPMTFETNGSYNGLFNTFVGISSGVSNTTGNLNTFVGSTAGQDNTNGDQNTFVGAETGQRITSGFHNTFIGCGAGEILTTNAYNCFFGTDCGLTFLYGDANCFMGQSTGNGSYGDQNVAIGYGAWNDSPGSFNVSFGTYALNLATGSGNNAIGYHAGYGTIGSYNITLGYWDNPSHNTNGSRNVYIGKNAGPSSNQSESDKLYIANALGTPLIGGDFSAGTVAINGGLSATGAVHRFQSATSNDTLVVTGGRVGIGNPSPAAVGFMDVGNSSVYGELIRFHYGVRLGGIGINANGSDYATAIYYNGATVGSFDSNGGLALGTFADSTTPPANGILVSGAVIGASTMTATNGFMWPTNYVAANFTPVAGMVKIVSSNGVLYKVTQLTTNLLSSTTP